MTPKKLLDLTTIENWLWDVACRILRQEREAGCLACLGWGPDARWIRK